MAEQPQWYSGTNVITVQHIQSTLSVQLNKHFQIVGIDYRLAVCWLASGLIEDVTASQMSRSPDNEMNWINATREVACHVSKDRKHLSWDYGCCCCCRCWAPHSCLSRKGCESMKKYVLFSHVCTSSSLSLSLSRKSALSYGVAGTAEATHLHLREHMCFKLSVRHVYFPSSPQVPGAQLCRHTTIPAMPAEHSHRGRAAQWAVWESEVATEAGGWERFKGSVCAWGVRLEGCRYLWMQQFLTGLSHFSPNETYAISFKDSKDTKKYTRSHFK